MAVRNSHRDLHRYGKICNIQCVLQERSAGRFVFKRPGDALAVRRFIDICKQLRPFVGQCIDQWGSATTHAISVELILRPVEKPMFE